LRSPLERQNTWPVADVNGDPTPSAGQYLLRRALGEPDAVRDELTTYVVQHLGDPHAVLGLDATGFRKKGRHAAGVARQDRGTAGRIETGQIGVVVAEARGRGHTLLERARALPQAGTDERARCRQAGLPDARALATTPPLARAFATGGPAKWVTGDRVDGDDRRLRMGVESHPQADGLAVSGQEAVGLEGQ
jgi:SRSO17 transposase